MIIWLVSCVYIVFFITISSLLNLSSFVVGDRPNVGYKLDAISNHFGKQSRGHCKPIIWYNKYRPSDTHE